jgi:hypothetical protein
MLDDPTEHAGYLVVEATAQRDENGAVSEMSAANYGNGVITVFNAGLRALPHLSNKGLSYMKPCTTISLDAITHSYNARGQAELSRVTIRP